jgi:alcohol dehydrogenase class IV
MNNAKPIPSLIAIPTTAGTGSEVGAWAVITNTKEHYKFFVGGWNCLPKVAIVDPIMTSTMPPSLTADTGIDALCHAIEAYCSPYGMPQTDLFALEAIKLVVRHLGPAVADGSNMNAREGMAMGALQAGLAMNAGCGGAHALGLQLTSKYGIPHGRTLAIVMPLVMNYNLIACVDRFIDIAKAMGERIERMSRMEAAERAPMAFEKFARFLGIKTTLSKDTEDPDLLPTCAKQALNNENIKGNPRVPTLGEIEELYRQAYMKERV